MITAAGIRQKQSLPLEAKIIMAQERIRQWDLFTDGDMYVSFSGGKDSTVLLHLVRSIYPRTPAVFVNTGLEYPEIVRFVRQTENVTWIRPKMRFKDVIEKYGYPVISKEVSQWLSEIATTGSDKLRAKRLGQLSAKWRYMLDAPFKISNRCCDIMKKNPAHAYEKQTGQKPLIGTMACDSAFRQQSIMLHGCNAYGIANPHSRPLSMWTEGDIWEYLRTFNVPYSEIYDMGYTRTGCMFCMFGLHLEMRENRGRFERMRHTHPRLYHYCMDNLGLRKVMEWYPQRGYVPQERIQFE